MITSLSPLDGRYKDKVEVLAGFFSEHALMKFRLLVEVRFFQALADEKRITELGALSATEKDLLESLVKNFSAKEAERVKTLEKTTNHDVKALEYYLKEKLGKTSLKNRLEFIHFACTSEDVNNLAYGLMLKGAIEKVMRPTLEDLQKTLKKQARAWQKEPLLALTHGQPATPTTVGKELKVFAHRLARQIAQLKKQEFLGKLNGATGNYSAHMAAYPGVDWPALSKSFVQSLGLTWNPLTTQIESHDGMAELFHGLMRANTILLNLNRDLWMYISRGVFRQKAVAGEIGSSTMPHKVNPIDFENAEGNLGLANALLSHMAEKLPISRLQRDLTDSTVQRNSGMAFGYALLAYRSTLKGLGRLELNKKVIQEELENNWELLAEPIQTVLRKHGVRGAYEKLKALTRGKKVTRETLKKFIQSLKIPEADKKRLLALTPATYLGLAQKL